MVMRKKCWHLDGIRLRGYRVIHEKECILGKMFMSKIVLILNMHILLTVACYNHDKSQSKTLTI